MTLQRVSSCRLMAPRSTPHAGSSPRSTNEFPWSWKPRASPFPSASEIQAVIGQRNHNIFANTEKTGWRGVPRLLVPAKNIRDTQPDAIDLSSQTPMRVATGCGWMY